METQTQPTMSIVLRPGDYCLPDNQEQWQRILDAAASAGRLHRNADIYPYEDNHRVWVSYGGTVCPLINGHEADRDLGREMSVEDFLSAIPGINTIKP